jgi:hypothetical protein
MAQYRLLATCYLDEQIRPDWYDIKEVPVPLFRRVDE